MRHDHGREVTAGGAAVATSQALVPRDLIKGDGGLARRAGLPGAVRRSRPLLVVILSPGGAGRGGHLGKPTSPRPRCWWCGLMAA
jgi:hypothetical protein